VIGVLCLQERMPLANSTLRMPEPEPMLKPSIDGTGKDASRKLHTLDAGTGTDASRKLNSLFRLLERMPLATLIRLDASCNPDSTAALLATDYFPLSTYLLLMALVFATLASYHAEYSCNRNLK